jgi:hypothetical protein
MILCVHAHDLLSEIAHLVFQRFDLLLSLLSLVDDLVVFKQQVFEAVERGPDQTPKPIDTFVVFVVEDE